MENHTAKHFVLQLGSLISLYLSLSFLLVLLFGFINILLPDSIASIWEVERAADSIRIGFAMALVFFPTYIILTRLVNKNRRKSTDHSYLGLTKWAIYLSLLLSGLVLLGDLVAVIMSFLEGELTGRFLLKAASVLLVIGGAFTYYILDAKNYWVKREQQSLWYGGVVSLLILSILVAALTQIPNPTQVREMKSDSLMVEALQNIQWRVEDYYNMNEELPADLSTIFGEFDVPQAPANKPDYTYEITGEGTYQLCATFTHPSTGVQNQYGADRVSIAPGFPGNYNWDHKAGEWCFERMVQKDFLR
jgi:type II secretory pathway pseudopilin PulG